MALGCVTVVWIVAVFGSFRHATREIGEWEDARLVEYASLLVDLAPADLERLARFPPDARIELAHGTSAARRWASSSTAPGRHGTRSRMRSMTPSSSLSTISVGSRSTPPCSRM